MKLKRLLPICAAALMMVGCLWESENKMAHYVIANSTDREIKLQTYYEKNGTGDIIWKDCLVIEPGGEGETTNIGSLGSVPPPFSGSNRILLSDGERTVLFRKEDYGDGNDFLFNLRYYQEIKYKRPHIWYKYTITEADFERGIPVDNE